MWGGGPSPNLVFSLIRAIYIINPKGQLGPPPRLEIHNFGQNRTTWEGSPLLNFSKIWFLKYFFWGPIFYYIYTFEPFYGLNVWVMCEFQKKRLIAALNPLCIGATVVKCPIVLWWNDQYPKWVEHLKWPTQTLADHLGRVVLYCDVSSYTVYSSTRLMSRYKNTFNHF